MENKIKRKLEVWSPGFQFRVGPDNRGQRARPPPFATSKVRVRLGILSRDMAQPRQDNKTKKLSPYKTPGFLAQALRGLEADAGRQATPVFPGGGGGGGERECGGKAKKKAFWVWVCACVCISAGLTARTCLELGCSVSLRHSMDSPGVQVRVSLKTLPAFW